MGGGGPQGLGRAAAHIRVLPCGLALSYSGLDEVIFSYVLGVLEDLGPSGPSEENFDMEAFIEMMEAYVPGFAHIPR